jgi:hypothetical protein
MRRRWCRRRGFEERDTIESEEDTYTKEIIWTPLG